MKSKISLSFFVAFIIFAWNGLCANATIPPELLKRIEESQLQVEQWRKIIPAYLKREQDIKDTLQEAKSLLTNIHLYVTGTIGPGYPLQTQLINLLHKLDGLGVNLKSTN